MGKIIPNHYLPLLLAFLVGEELSANYILFFFAEQSLIEKSVLYICFFCLQIICAPIQSAVSDLYCRKKSLVVALSMSFAAVLCVYVFNTLITWTLLLIMILICKSVFGNILPLCLAGIADTQDKNVRLSMGLATGSMAFGYLILILLEDFLDIQTIGLVILVLFCLLIFVCSFFYIDIRDKEPHEDVVKIKNPTLLRFYTERLSIIFEEFNHIISSLKDNRTFLALMTFLMWEITQYTINTSNVDLRLSEFSGVTATYSLGYIFGLIALWKWSQADNYKMIKIGYVVSAVSVMPLFLLYPFGLITDWISMTCYFFSNLGTAFLAPSLFSILAGEREAHQQGKIFGLLESTDTVTMLTSSLIGIAYSFETRISVVLVAISFSFLIGSLLVYSKFKKAKPATHGH